MVNRKLVMKFSVGLVDQPIIYRLIKNYDLMVNIIKGNINPRREGSLIVELSGTAENFQAGTQFLEDLGVVVEPLSQTVVRDEHLCSHCGACTAICPVSALYLQRPSMEVGFDSEKCIACGVCVAYCPLKALDLNWGD